MLPCWLTFRRHDWDPPRRGQRLRHGVWEAVLNFRCARCGRRTWIWD